MSFRKWGGVELLPSNYFKLYAGKFVENNPLNSVISAPITIFLEVTRKCNLRCAHCLNNSGISFDDELTLSEIANVVKDLTSIGVFNMKVSGGEPFIRDDIVDIFEIMENNDMNFTVYTNGMFLNSDVVCKLREFKHLTSVRVSVDGNETINDSIRGKGTYKKAIKALKLLCTKGVPCELNYTVTSKNYGVICEVAEDLKKYGINCKINLGMVKISGRVSADSRYYCVSEDINKCILSIQKQIGKHPVISSFYELKPIYYKLFKNTFGCPAARMSATIKSNGNVFACGIFYDNPNYVCGNVRKESFITIWNGEMMEYFRSIPENKKCLKCAEYKSKCTGACRGNALNVTGDLSGDDINCDYYKVNFNVLRDKKNLEEESK